MFHAFDNAGVDPVPRRAHWMALLARAPLPLLESTVGAHAAAPRWLRAPETGLMMVQGRAGGTGERFNLGEVTVTRCVLRLPVPGDAAAPSGCVGVAYVLGRSHRHAQLAAVADALLQDPAHEPDLQQRLLAPITAHLAVQRAQRQARAQSTKVEFFTVAREAGGVDEEDAE